MHSRYCDYHWLAILGHLVAQSCFLCYQQVTICGLQFTPVFAIILNVILLSMKLSSMVQLSSPNIIVNVTSSIFNVYQVFIMAFGSLSPKHYILLEMM